MLMPNGVSCLTTSFPTYRLNQFLLYLNFFKLPRIGELVVIFSTCVADMLIAIVSVFDYSVHHTGDHGTIVTFAIAQD